MYYLRLPRPARRSRCNPRQPDLGMQIQNRLQKTQCRRTTLQFSASRTKPECRELSWSCEFWLCCTHLSKKWGLCHYQGSQRTR